MSTRRSPNKTQSPKDLNDDTWSSVLASTTSGPVRQLLGQINRSTRRIAKVDNDYISIVRPFFEELRRKKLPVPVNFALNKDLVRYSYKTTRFDIDIDINQGHPLGYRTISGIYVYDNERPSDAEKYSNIWHTSGSVRRNGQPLSWNIYPDSNIFTLFMIRFILVSDFLKVFEPPNVNDNAGLSKRLKEAFADEIHTLRESWNSVMKEFGDHPRANEKQWTIFRKLVVKTKARPSK